MTAAAPPNPFFRPVLAVASAELRTFWGGAASGVALLVFLGLLGFFFYNSVAAYVLDSLAAAAKGQALDASLILFAQGLAHIPLVLMLVTPLATMRALASFRRGGGLDWLQTLPVSRGRLIFGQYLAAWLSLAFLGVLALLPFAVLAWLGVGRPELLATAAVGLLGLASVFAAVGLLASAAFPSPVGAGLTTLGGLGLMWVLGWATPYADGQWGGLWAGLAFGPRIERCILGLVDLNDLAFFAALTVLALVNARLLLGWRAHSGAD